MSSPVIPAEAAKDLDALAQTINPILFWTCNYQPTFSYAISEDAQFFIGIQDLYKFAFDTNCVLKGIASNNKSSICQDLLSKADANNLRSVTETVQMLRSVLGHNHSGLNGKMDSDELDAYRGWIRVNLGKDKPTAQKDFAELNAALGNMGADLIRLSEQVITCIRGRQDADAIAEEWIEKTLQWYCTGTHQNYYRGQLCDLYYAQGCERRGNFANIVDGRELVLRVNRWINNWATHEFDSALKKIEDEGRNLSSLINSPSSAMLDISRQDPEKYNAVLEDWQRRLTEIGEESVQIREDKKQSEQECLDKYRTKINYFFDDKRLYGQLRKTLERLQNDQTAFTLLPQDFLFFDIMHNFKGVRVPNSDFSPL